MATISTTLAAGSTTSPYFFDVRITKQLCNKTPNAPVFVPIFTLVSYSLVSATVAEGQYEAIVNVQGIATYTPCNSCCAKSQTVNQTLVIPFYSATAPSAVSVTSGNPVNTLITGGGCNSCCSNTFQCNVPLNLTVETT